MTALVDTLTSQPALAIADPSETFTILTDASDYAVGALLRHERGVIAYDSASLNKCQRQYSVRDKELFALVRALRTWRHYIGHGRVVALTDHLSLTTLNSTTSLDTCLALRWAFLASFDIDIQYKPGRPHDAADFFSRIPTAAVTRSAKRTTTQRRGSRQHVETQPHEPAHSSGPATAASSPPAPPAAPGQFPNQLPRECMKPSAPTWPRIGYLGPSPAAQAARDGAPSAAVSSILLPWYALAADGSLWHRGINNTSQLCVPNGNIRRKLVKFCHEVELCHRDAERVTSTMAAHFYWPDMLAYIARIVRRCFTCAATKPHRITYGKLEPPTRETCNDKGGKRKE